MGIPVEKDELNKRLAAIFLPDAYRRVNDIKSDADSRFVYYTSATTGIKIVRNKEVWLRNSRVMNDFSEIHHGQGCLQNSWRSKSSGVRIKSILNLLSESAVSDLEKSLDEDQFRRQHQTFILSISEHGPRNLEDRFGRLSMWRAYGGQTNVAFVLKTTPFVAESNAIGAYTAPVLYADQDDFDDELMQVAMRMEEELAFLKSIAWESLHKYLHEVLRFLILSTKHPGFREEREWRTLFTPDETREERLLPSLEDIGGVPQKVYKLPLKSYPDEGLTGLEIDDLLDRVIIGPVEFPLDVFDAFVEALRDAGVSNPVNRVVISGVPLRR